MSDVLLVESRGPVEVWTLHRPESLNAFNKALLTALNVELKRLEAVGPAVVRCVVLRGEGKAFSAGADLKERRTMPARKVPAFVSLIGSTFTRIARAAPPFVAAIDGYAFGGGLELALACDIRAVGARALMGLTETRLAIIPGAGGTQRLPRLVGPGRAKELILTGRRVGPVEALEIGLVELDGRASSAFEVAMATADLIAEGGPVGVQAAKAAVEGGFDLPMDEALAHERACYDRTVPTQDRLEALAAFSEKRPPVYRGA